MPETEEMAVIGKAQPRIDGPLKVSGRAMYATDHHFPGMLYAVPVEATIANGKIEKLDTAAAEKMSHVRAIFHRENIGKISRSTPGEGFEGICIERRPPFEDDVIRYYGQYVALAVADTFEAAKAAADAVQVTYDEQKPNVATELQADDDPEVVVTPYGPEKRLQSERGDPDKARTIPGEHRMHDLRAPLGQRLIVVGPAARVRVPREQQRVVRMRFRVQEARAQHGQAGDAIRPGRLGVGAVAVVGSGSSTALSNLK